MKREFIDFVESILPTVDLESRNAVKRAIEKFNSDGGRLWFTTSEPLPEISQGDIIGDVPFSYFDEEGRLKTFNAEAIVISTSCTIDQKEQIMLSPVIPAKNVNVNHADVEKNLVYEYMFIPDACINDKYIHIGFISTIDKRLIMQGLERKKIKRIVSLNQIGYYLLVLKLTILLFRKEDGVTMGHRIGTGYV